MLCLLTDLYNNIVRKYDDRFCSVERELLNERKEMLNSRKYVIDGMKGVLNKSKYVLNEEKEGRNASAK